MTVSKKRAMPVKGPYLDFGSNQDYLQKNAEKVFLFIQQIFIKC